MAPVVPSLPFGDLDPILQASSIWQPNKARHRQRLRSVPVEVLKEVHDIKVDQWTTNKFLLLG